MPRFQQIRFQYSSHNNNSLHSNKGPMICRGLFAKKKYQDLNIKVSGFDLPAACRAVMFDM